MYAERDHNGVVRLVTTTRRELFNLSALLAKGISPDLLQDKNDPLFVYVVGSFQSGKKIFADAMRRTLMSSTTLAGFKGRKEYDEFWSYRSGHSTFEMDFINAAWGAHQYSGFLRDRLSIDESDPHDKLRTMHGLRRHGGVTFIHNGDGDVEKSFLAKDLFPAYENDSRLEGRLGLDIRVRGHDDGGVPHFFLPAPPKIKQAFNSTQLEWARYVRIEALDPHLTSSSVFQAAMAEICAGAYKDNENYDMIVNKKAARRELKAGIISGLSSLIPRRLRAGKRHDQSV